MRWNIEKKAAACWLAENNISGRMRTASKWCPISPLSWDKHLHPDLRSSSFGNTTGMQALFKLCWRHLIGWCQTSLRWCWWQHKSTNNCKGLQSLVTPGERLKHSKFVCATPYVVVYSILELSSDFYLAINTTCSKSNPSPDIRLLGALPRNVRLVW